jgi:hypothetical protein
MPPGHKNGHVPLYEGCAEPPPSLCEAIDAFVLACALRRLRGQASKHTSMLVHVTRFTSVQKAVHFQVEDRVRQLRQCLQRRTAGHAEILLKLRSLWERDFVETTAAVIHELPDATASSTPLSWLEIEAILAEVVSDIQVRMINGTAKDALDYAENQETGLKVIAVGGDKLARGLTLEGLTVSYFLRASKMYDTLMQMGRWFGYRPGYLDLCRLYTTEDLVNWFEHIADASEELRDEFDMMAASGASPREYGLKVQSHPTLMVTSSVKMRNARELYLSFSGSLMETVTFHREKDKITKNFEAAQRLILSLQIPEKDPQRHRNGTTQNWKGYLWNDVPPAAVISFLEEYQSHKEAQKTNSGLIAQFIGSLVSKQELGIWTVALIGGGQEKTCSFDETVRVNMLQRSAHGQFADRYSIGRLMSPRDEAIDLTESEWMEALSETRRAFFQDSARNEARQEPDAPNGPAIRHVRPRDRGVLFLYPIDPDGAGEAAGLSPGLPAIIGFAVSLPASESGVRVKYSVNNIFWTQEHGGVD